MSRPKTVDFWFDFASTYSYPAAMTIEAQAAKRGVVVRWQPFLLGPVFADQGWTDSPFNLQPAKGRYMWRDLDRICEGLGLPFRRPYPFPQHSVAAARLALIGLEEGWGRAFCTAVFHAEFAEGADISGLPVLNELARGAGAKTGIQTDPFPDRIKLKLRDVVDQARTLGIFGAPTFLAGEEMFWGFDRMEAALDWATAHA